MNNEVEIKNIAKALKYYFDEGEVHLVSFEVNKEGNDDWVVKTGKYTKERQLTMRIADMFGTARAEIQLDKILDFAIPVFTTPWGSQTVELVKPKKLNLLKDDVKKLRISPRMKTMNDDIKLDYNVAVLSAQQLIKLGENL